MSGSHILDRQNPIFSVRHSSTEKFFFKELDLFQIQLGQIFPKSQLKVSTCVKLWKKRNYVMTGPKCQVHYIQKILAIFFAYVCK